MSHPKTTEAQNRLLRRILTHHRSSLGGQLDRGAEHFSICPARFLRVEGRQLVSARKLAEMGLIELQDPTLRGEPQTFARHLFAGLRVPPKYLALLCDSILHDKSGDETQHYVEHFLRGVRYRRDTSHGLIASAFGQVKYDLHARGYSITRLYARTYNILTDYIEAMKPHNPPSNGTP